MDKPVSLSMKRPGWPMWRERNTADVTVVHARRHDVAARNLNVV